MQRTQRRIASNERGQVLVIVGVGLVALMAMVGLVIDGGYAWAQQRETQNGADSVAKAGTVVIQGHLAGNPATSGAVGCAIDAAEAAHGIVVANAVFTNEVGTPLAPEIEVAACGSTAAIPAGAQGVKADTEQEFDTFLMGLVGINELTATADATAVVGRETSICPATMGCGVLPVTFPHRAMTCNGTNNQVIVGEGDWQIHDLDDPATVLDASNLSVLPLCTSGPGSVGWLDFGCTPNLASMIDNPCNSEVSIETWLQTKSGNTNSLETNLNVYTGSQVGVAEPQDLTFQIPIHDFSCDIDLADTAPVTACPSYPNWSGNGDNLYYHVPYWQGFKIDAAYTGGNDAECNQAPGLPMGGGNGGTGCLKGWFVSRTFGPGFVSTGPITPGAPGTFAVVLVN